MYSPNYYFIQIIMTNLISIGMQNNKTYYFNKHIHKYWEITYYFEGCGKNITNNSDYFFNKGTIICQPPYIEHEDISENGYKNIYFCIEKFYFPINDVMVFHDTANFDFLYVLKQLYNESFNHSDNLLIIESILNVLQHYLVFLKDNIQKNNYVECFERELIKNLSNSDFKISEEMNKIPLCSDHFRRLFKKEIGQTPQEYLLNKRLEYSMQLLLNSTLSIKNISQMSGFSDPYYFSRIFKKYKNFSPEIWRDKSKI